MKFIIGKNRSQIPLFVSSLDETIDQNNEIRLIDLFVDSLKLSDFGFKMDFIENGRPAYHPADLLKLFIYGYLNRMRSSRILEKECKRNIELMWLLKGLTPDHNTISNFRKDNPNAIQKVFRQTVKLAKHFDLIGGKLLAGDSTKLRAQNSKKNNFNPKKIQRHLVYIDNKLEEYNAALDLADGDENKKVIQQHIDTHNQRKDFYNDLTQQLEESGQTQISTSDPDSRQMITRNNITEVAYSVQTTVDAKHNIPIDYKLTNENDSKAMGGMARRAKTILGKNDFTLLYDKGYHTGSEFAYADAHGVEVMVAIPEVASHAPDIAFDVEHFEYDKQNDCYTCPANELLTTNGRWYNKSRGKSSNKIKQYTTKACKGCEYNSRCTNNKAGRMLERSEHADLIFENKQRIVQNKQRYRRRQAIVEHPYGIIKRQWGFYYISTKKGIKRAAADVGLIFTAYNLRRIFNLIDKNVLQKFLKELSLFMIDFLAVIKSFKPFLTRSIFNNLVVKVFFNIRQIASFTSAFLLYLIK
ncbi:IS1182 family transposase [Lutibacter sp.]|uniref:IS1182 family transposase n=1 Tax=Lutibacter sp. TaxID=1925666 RepID=UPI00273346FA|nr:IS1182 family transposase [Lutibacter sp.]MDP3314096.1 IS1182 family transposase [Lutibacter sp.]